MVRKFRGRPSDGFAPLLTGLSRDQPDEQLPQRLPRSPNKADTLSSRFRAAGAAVLGRLAAAATAQPLSPGAPRMPVLSKDETTARLAAQKVLPLFNCGDAATAMGALEALRQNGLAGKVPVVGIDGIDAALSAIEAGEFAGTVAWDPLWTGGMGLAIPYAHATGKIDICDGSRINREINSTIAATINNRSNSNRSCSRSNRLRFRC